MKLIGMMLARNEDWIIGLSARVALQWCDDLIVYADKCTDRTVEIARGLGCHVIDDVDAGGMWDEMRVRQRVLEIARDRGATHMALIDADEFLTANLLPRIREKIEALEPGECLNVPMIPAWGAIDRHRVDPCVWVGQTGLSLAFADSPEMRWRDRDGYQHHHRHPFGSRSVRSGWTPADGGVVHAQWASMRRAYAKSAWYRMIERLRWPFRQTPQQIADKYQPMIDETGLRTEPMPSEWIDGLPLEECAPSREPWQIADIEIMIREYTLFTWEGLRIWPVLGVISDDPTA